MSSPNPMNSQHKLFFYAIALFIIPLSGMSIDIYTPSLPAIAYAFHASKADTQITVTIYMLGLGLMQLFSGGISDSFGRKKPFLLGMLLFLVITLCIPHSQTLTAFIIYRFFQGCSVAIIMVPMRSVVSDLYEGSELKKKMSYMMMAWALGPIVAPAIGGYLQNTWGWISPFYFLTLYGFLGFTIALLFLPETIRYRHPFQFFHLLERYKMMLKEREYVAAFVINGFLYGFIVLFPVVGSFLIQNILHYSSITFGHIAMLGGFVWFLGNMTHRLTIHRNLFSRTQWCFWLMMFIALLTVYAAFAAPMNLWNIVTPFLLLAFLAGISFPAFVTHGLSLFPNSSGSANALFASLQVLIAGLSTAFGSFLESNTSRSLSLTYFGIIGICLIVFYMSKQKLN